MNVSSPETDTTVVIPARDAAETIGRCLDRVFALDQGPSRVVVLDDHSSDATAAIARSWHAEVVEVPEGGGLGLARNVGLAECRTRFLAFLNADCYPSPDWLKVLQAALQATGSAAAGGRQVELRRDTLAERWKARHLRQDLGEQRVITPDFLSGGNLLLDLTRLNAATFDPRYRAAYEDVAFCRLLRAQGGCLVYEPAAAVEHDHRETMRTLPRKVWSYGVHSRTVGPITRLRQVPQAILCMHRRPHDQVRRALLADLRHGRLAYVAVDVYLLCASVAFFVGLARSRPTPSNTDPDFEPRPAKG